MHCNSIRFALFGLMLLHSVVEAKSIWDGVDDRDEYYGRLKLTRDATTQDVRRAFQRLAEDHGDALHQPERSQEEHDRLRKEHLAKGEGRLPKDLHPETPRIVRKKEDLPDELVRLSRAYEVLSDARLRRAYDEGGHDAVSKIVEARKRQPPPRHRRNVHSRPTPSRDLNEDL